MSKPTVLIIDDMHMNMFTLTHILKDEYNVCAAESGADGLEVAKNVRPNIILLDIIMPDMNGFEVIAALKEDPDTRDIPVIFITGQDSDSDEEQGLLLGAVDYITKPFSTHIVKLRIHNHLKFHKQEQVIQELSTLDPLTSLVTRKYIDTIMDAEWQKALKGNLPVSLVIFNIDNFSDYNEKYGQSNGDHALKELSKIIIRNIDGPGRFAARWSGDEIAVLMPSANAQTAMEFSENVQKNIAQERSSLDSNILTGFTTSIGVSSATPAPGLTASTLVDDATVAVAQAKAEGRNRVCLKS